MVPRDPLEEHAGLPEGAAPVRGHRRCEGLGEAGELPIAIGRRRGEQLVHLDRLGLPDNAYAVEMAEQELPADRGTSRTRDQDPRPVDLVQAFEPRSEVHGIAADVVLDMPRRTEDADGGVARGDAHPEVDPRRAALVPAA